jgi:hypothetical protein
MQDSTVNVVIRPGVNYRAERLKPKDIIAVSGLLDTTTDVPRLLPRQASEIRLVTRAPEPLKETTLSPSKGPTLPPWAPIGVAGGAIVATEGAKRLHKRHKQKKIERKLKELA